MKSFETYVCLLRGINVSGKNIIKMEALRESFQNSRLQNVQTYLQSGNVVFRAPKKSCLDIQSKISKIIADDFGFSPFVLVKTAHELQIIAKENPFLRDNGIDAKKLHVTFLSQTPNQATLKNMNAIDAKSDTFFCTGDIVYLLCSEGYGRTKLSNNAIERVLNVSATTRNWKTLCALNRICAGKAAQG